MNFKVHMLWWDYGNFKEALSLGVFVSDESMNKIQDIRMKI